MYHLFKKYNVLVFTFALICLYVLFSYHEIIFRQPYGIHFIRQTDGLSFVSNYYHHGFRFFQPELYNLMSIEGKNACEFPIIYYLTALLYLIFGEHDFILRFITLTFSTLGFIYLFKISKLWIDHVLIAFLLTLLLLSSPILQYYSINFLPDGIVLPMTIIGLYHSFHYFKHLNKKNILFAFLCFGFAALLKVTYFIYPLALIFCLLIKEYFTSKNVGLSIKKNAVFIKYFLLCFFIVLLWTIYVFWYNKVNLASYFTIQPMPIWEMSKVEIQDVFNSLTNMWKNDLYYPSTIHFLYVILVIFVLFFLKNTLHLRIWIVLTFLGLACYFLLFMQQFKYHDYYFLAFYPFVFILVFTASEKLILWMNKKWFVNFYAIILLVFVGLSFKHAYFRLEERFDYARKDIHADIGKRFQNTRKFLEQKKVSKDAKFIIFNDLTPNGGLYYIQRKGWNVVDTIGNNMNLYRYFLTQNPDYIIFTNKKLIQHDFRGKLIGVENGNYIFRLNK